MGDAQHIDYRATFADVVAVVENARSATLGWRALCVRERRRVGPNFIDPLSELDLDDDAVKIARTVREIAWRAPRPADTLVFGLFDTIDDGSGGYAGYHVSAIASHGRSADDFMRDPWARDGHVLPSLALHTLSIIASRAPHDVRPILEYSLLFGAAALVSRFGVSDLPHRLVVSFDEDHGRVLPADAPRFAEIFAVRRRADSVTESEAAMRLVNGMWHDSS